MEDISSPPPKLATPHHHPWWLSLPAVSLCLALAAALAYHSLTDFDIWFHLRAGRDLFAGHGIPHVNTYSFANPSYPWLNHEWLFQAAMAQIAPQGSPILATAAGLNLARIVLVIILALVLIFDQRNGYRLRSPARPDRVARSALVTAGALGLIWPRFILRPELISLIFMVLLVRRAEGYYQRQRPPVLWRDSALWRIFALVLIWAQCHGFVAIAPLILLIAATSQPPSPAGRSWGLRDRWLPVPVAILALTLTPNLWRGLVYPFQALASLNHPSADLSHTIAELTPLLATPNALHLTITGFQLSLVWGLVFALLSARHLSPLRLVLFVLAAFAAVANERNIAVYGVTFALLHGGLSGCWPHPWWRRHLRWPPAFTLTSGQSLILTTLAIVILTGVWLPSLANNEFYLHEGVGRRFGGGITPALYPQKAAIALSASPNARTFANLDSAAFLLGNTPVQLFIDGRTEAYPPKRWAEYNRLKQGGDTALEILRTHRTDAVVLSLRSKAFDNLAATLLQSPKWSLVAAGAGEILWRTGSKTQATTTKLRLMAAAHQLATDHVADRSRAADIQLAAANLYELAQEPDLAREALIRGLQYQPHHPTLNHNLGNIFLAAGEFERAAAYFQQALKTNPRLAGAALNDGVCQLKLQHSTAAITAFRRALQIDASQFRAWANLATALRRTGEPLAAQEALEEALTLRPEDPRLRAQLRRWRQAPSGK